MPLTQKEVESSKPAATMYRVWDSQGLYLEVSPAGGKWWRLKFRFGGKEKRMSLGTLPDVSLKAARRKRDAARALLADGVDPTAVRKEAKREAAGRAANSFEAVARELYGKQAHVWVPHHASDVLRRLESNLFPEIGERPIAEITAPMLLAAVRKIEHRGAYDLAHRVLQVASQVFRYGVATGRCERDPAPDLRGALTPHKGKHQAAVTPEELPALLRAIYGYGEVGDKLTGHALRLLALTFVRTGELIGAEWSEIDLDSSVWIIPAARMKMKTEHVVPLSRQSIEMLAEVCRRECHGQRICGVGSGEERGMSGGRNQPAGCRGARRRACGSVADEESKDSDMANGGRPPSASAKYRDSDPHRRACALGGPGQGRTVHPYPLRLGQ